MKKSYFSVLICLAFLAITIFSVKSVSALTITVLKGELVSTQSFSSSLSGKILLQVQAKGEAWYVNPSDNKRYYLGRPADAFALMRGLGVGITNDNLNKIQIGAGNLAGAVDTDGDGLSDALEDSLGTDKTKTDTDSDGYNDKVEILGGYNPAGAGKLPLDNALAASLKGKILLQVQKNGEAWYVNPVDSKRYFLGRPADAFNLMRQFGLGITNSDLDKIEINLPSSNQPSQNSSSTAPVILPPQIPAVASSTHPTSSPVTPTPVAANCNSLDCLIAKAPNCQNGNATFSFTMPFPLAQNLIINGNTYIEITGKNSDGTCAFTQRLIEGTVTISDNDRRRLVASGVTDAQINAQIAVANQSLEGDTTKSLMSCAGTGTNLAQYLTNVKGGTLNSNCAIAIFSPESQCTTDPNLTCIVKTP